MYVDSLLYNPLQNPLGKPEFSVQFDMREFKPEDISLTTKHGKLIISGWCLCYVDILYL